MTKIIKKAKDRIIKNYVTTIVGLLLICGAGYIAIFQNNTERASFIGGYGLLFLRSKDSLIGLSK